MTPPLERRRIATQATMEKFGPRPFDWGSADCAKMVGFHLRRFGHKVPFSKGGPYKSQLGAVKALKKAGFPDLPTAMTAMLPEIPLAYAMMGDVVSFPSDHPIGALGIVLGNGNMMCYHEAYDIPVVVTMEKIDKAWSVLKSG